MSTRYSGCETYLESEQHHFVFLFAGRRTAKNASLSAKESRFKYLFVLSLSYGSSLHLLIIFKVSLLEIIKIWKF